MADTDTRKAQKAARKSAEKSAKKSEKSQKKAAAKDYERRHAQLKRTQAFHATLIAAQAKRAKKQAKRDAS
jgi:hypothetical protein